MPFIFINKDAEKLDELFLNKKYSLSRLTDNIYTISIRKQPSNWLIKTYQKEKYAKRESETLYKLRKIEGIPRVLAVGLSKGLNYIIISQAKGMDLIDYIAKNGVICEIELRGIATQLLTIVRQIHEHNIIHRDIKPENIVYDGETKKLVLIDFEGKQTDVYCSPEQVHGIDISNKIDIWSAGITLYTLLRGNPPFKNNKEILQKKLTFPKKWNSNLCDFLSCLIERDIKLRYSAKEALDHAWLFS